MLSGSSCAASARAHRPQVVQHGDSTKLPRRRRLGAARGSGTRLLLFGGWDGSHTTNDMLEVDTSEWLRLQGPASGGLGPEVKAKRPAGTLSLPAGGEHAGGTGGGGFGSNAGPGGGGGSSSGAIEVAMERLEAKHEEELQRMRGEVARLRMSNELMSREMHKLKSLVGAQLPGDHGGVDVDALASRREVEALRAEVAKLRKLNSQEREADQGALHAELDSLRRAVHALALHIDERGERVED